MKIYLDITRVVPLFKLEGLQTKIFMLTIMLIVCWLITYAAKNETVVTPLPIGELRL